MEGRIVEVLLQTQFGVPMASAVLAGLSVLFFLAAARKDQNMDMLSMGPMVSGIVCLVLAVVCFLLAW